YSSLLALNPPVYTWLVMPFADHPWVLVVLTVIASCVAVGLTYLLAERLFSRRVALITGLLYATATYPLWMSTFIWQQTALPLFTVAALWLVWLGVAEQRKGWLIPHVALVAALAQLYPLMLSLLALTALGWLFARRAIRWLEIVGAALVAAVITAPTVLFEIASHGLDMPAYQRYVFAAKSLDGQVFSAIFAAISPLDAYFIGPSTLYAVTEPWLHILVVVMPLLWALSTLWLASRVVRPLWRVARRAQPARSALTREWQVATLLLIWPAVFIAATLRHSSPVYMHYAFVLLPVLFLTIGLWLSRLPRYWRALASRFPSAWRASATDAAQPVGTALVGVLIVAQLIPATALSLSMGTGQAAAQSLGDQSIRTFTGMVDAVTSAAGRYHAGTVYLAGELPDAWISRYWAQRANALNPNGPVWVSLSLDQCLLTPPADAGPGLLVIGDATGLAARDFIFDPANRPVASADVAAGERVPIYRLPAARAVAQPIGAVNGELRLDSAQVLPARPGLPRRLITRWTSRHAWPDTRSTPVYYFHVLVTQPNGALEDVWSACAPSQLPAGSGLTVITPLPPDLPRSFPGPTLGIRHDQAGIAIIVERATETWYRPTLGSLQLESAKQLIINRVVLPPGDLPAQALLDPTHADLITARLAIPRAAIGG
ncbi:MAG TPA: glycosyltransferase family 39 protein, partial [Ktedonobacterales bacterium]